jgi:predicted ATPase/DNA-binding SARP family transcriptional activator
MTQTLGLCIYLLGPMRIERNHVPIHLPRRKVESLLAYLILHPERHSRDHLATLLWGDSSDAQARHSLRTALATIRQQVSPDLLLTDRDHVQLNSALPLWVDLHQLLDLENEHEQAGSDLLQANLALWQGELLADMYDEWIAGEREHYRARLLRLFLQITHTMRARSEYARAIAVAQRVLAFDPANEHAHQHLMFCYVASGDRPAALRQYELCARALLEDLDAPPMPETTALYQWIKQFDGDEPSSAGRITNLPIPLTSFVGRTRETAEVKRLLSLARTRPSRPERAGESPVRLLTLIGAGGSGKTRLAIQAATDLIDRYADGVWWVELAALSDGGLVGRAVAKTLGVHEVPDQSVSQTVADYLADKHLLVVLDNCEHVIEPCAQIAAELLARCPGLQILATSREPLNIAGENLWQVPAFAAPDPAQLALVDLLLQYESLRLFVERAAAVQPGFALTPENARAVAEICQRLDGIPLAIELAAARVKVLTVEQIAAYLTGALGARFALLTQGSRAAMPRHQTLRATVDWSYALLDEAERTLFRQVAVFHGGFTLDALAQIVDFEGAGARPLPRRSPSNAPPVLDLLTQLVDKSLVMVEPQPGQNRYRMLETLREYALEQSPDGDEMKRVQRRHAEYFLHLAQQAAPNLSSSQQHSWLGRLEIEHPNLRAALDYLIADADGDRALRLATALHRFWDYRGYVGEGREWLRKALAIRETAALEAPARALHAAGWLAYRQGDLGQARQLLDEGLFLFEQAEDEYGIVDILQLLSIIDMDQGDYTAAQQRLEQGLNLARALNYESGIALYLDRLGSLAWDHDRFADAGAFHGESRRINQLLGEDLNVAFQSLAIGDAERMLGNLDAARAYYDECLQIAQTLGHKGLTGAVLKSMGMLAFKQEDYGRARQYGEDALRIFRELGDRVHTGFALGNLGDVARKLGAYSQALAYYSQYLQIMHEVGYKWPTFFALEDIAYLLREAEQHAEPAVRFMSAAERLRRETGIDVAPYQQEKHDRVSTGLRQQLGDSRFDKLWQEGHATPLAEIVAEATRLALT